MTPLTRAAAGCLKRATGGAEPGATPAPAREAAAARGRRGATGALALLACGFCACFAPDAERLSCSDVLAPADVDFRTIQALVQDPEKGCLDSECHSAGTQQQGIRLDTPKLVYDEMSTRPDLFYSVLASGEMPDQGTAWSEAELRAFRSWYCAGALPQ